MVEVLGKGFKAIEQGLDKLMKGVSGTKYVCSESVAVGHVVCLWTTELGEIGSFYWDSS